MMKQKAKDRHTAPLWLRQLGRVKTELRGVRWPSEEEGFQQGLALMAFGLLMKSRDKNLQAFAKLDRRWIARWKKERDRFFPR